MKKKKRPEWVPENAGKEFTTIVMKGVDQKNVNSVNNNKTSPRRRNLSIDEYINGVLRSDRTVLARAITLVESNSIHHFDQAQQLLRELLPSTGRSVRIGITGVPGVGKSTFIEALGYNLVQQGHKLAVLAIDPSSTLTRGSVLGDKTRMEKLSREENCFIRPSPSAGTLGGVTRKTRETILLCEAAGYDVIFVETVGVGQNEIAVRNLVDFFLLLKIPGAGDELQGIKKGIIEIADGILINKADGDNLKIAEIARDEFGRALHYLRSPTPGWKPQVKMISSLENSGISETWQMIREFLKVVKDNNFFDVRRKNQMLDWVHDLVRQHLDSMFYNDPVIKDNLPEIESLIEKGSIPPTEAARKLINLFHNKS